MNQDVETKLAFDAAYAACLGQCFETLVLNLISEQVEDADEKFKECCEFCRKAREVAKGVE